jgi:putative NADH-flavin reductase
MKVLVFGASGGTGRRIVEQALAEGHLVTAFARERSRIRIAHENLRVARGDILLYDTVEAAISGQDAVLSALGVRLPVRTIILTVLVCLIVSRIAALTGPASLFVEIGIPILAILLLSRRTHVLSEGTRNIVRAMEKQGVRRFICESSLGVGDSKWRLGLLNNLIAVPLFLRNVFADKETQEGIIRESALEWVIVRPTVLTNGARRGVYRAGSDIGHWLIPTRISRADVAEFMLKQVTDDSYLHQSPGLAY